MTLDAFLRKFGDVDFYCDFKMLYNGKELQIKEYKEKDFEIVLQLVEVPEYFSVGENGG